MGSSKQTMIDWRIGNDGWDDVEEVGDVDEVDDGQHESDNVGSQTQRTAYTTRRRRRMAVTLGLVAALIIAGLGALEWRTQQTVTAVQAEVQSVLDQEMWALESDNWELYESVLDQEAPAQWYRAQQGSFIQNAQHGSFSAVVTDLALVQPDVALAEVQIELPSGERHRETRAFRQVGTTWRHTSAPAGNPWLRPIQRETANLRVIFHPDDADRIAPLVPKLQVLYTDLLKDFGLTPLPNRRELQVVLSVQPANAFFADPGRYYDLSSLAHVDDAERIQRELGTQLVSRVVEQFFVDAGEMAFVLDGVRRWEVSHWMGQPDPTMETRVARTLERYPHLPLMQVRPQTPPANLDRQVSTTLAETVVDYFVWRNGQGVIRDLMRSARESDSWPDFIEQGLELSYEDVDRGWWHFLTTQYATSTDRPRDRTLADLRWMLRLENQAVETRSEELFRSLLDPRAASEWKNQQLSWFWRNSGPRSSLQMVEVTDWGYMQDSAWVVLARRPDVEVSDSNGDFWARPALRIYRLADQRWYLTSPATAFAGPPLTTSTEHFEFRYREPDRSKLPTLTADVDELYEQLTRDLGIRQTAPRRIRVELMYEVEAIQSGSSQSYHIRLPSPRLLPLFLQGQELTPEEAVRAYLAYTLCDVLLTRVAGVQRHQVNDSPLQGFALWEAEQWGRLPHSQTARRDAIQRALKQDRLSLSSGDLSTMRSSEDVRLRQYTYVTLIEYVAEAYGRHRLADIVNAAKEHRELRDLIPAALGVDLATFEAGWRSYLERTYSE